MACALITPAQAADAVPRPAKFTSPAGLELRLGLFAHDPGSPESGSADVNAEILFPRWWGSESEWPSLFPRLQLGTTINTAGKTSTAYAGLAWTYDFTNGVFVEGSLGGVIHNGYTGTAPSPDHNALGCNPLFRESASLGYRLTPQLSVMATVEHSSNGGLCSKNRGLTNTGIRLGYSF